MKDIRILYQIIHSDKYWYWSKWETLLRSVFFFFFAMSPSLTGRLCHLSPPLLLFFLSPLPSSPLQLELSTCLFSHVFQLCSLISVPLPSLFSACSSFHLSSFIHWPNRSLSLFPPPPASLPSSLSTHPPPPLSLSPSQFPAHLLSASTAPVRWLSYKTDKD